MFLGSQLEIIKNHKTLLILISCRYVIRLKCKALLNIKEESVISIRDLIEVCGIVRLVYKNWLERYRHIGLRQIQWILLPNPKTIKTKNVKKVFKS